MYEGSPGVPPGPSLRGPVGVPVRVVVIANDLPIMPNNL